MREPDPEHVTMVEDCEHRESRLNEWEREFIDSMRMRIDEGKPLTPGQAEKLGEVWESATKKG